MKKILITSGEPAGIGPDICLSLAFNDLPVVVLADIDVLKQRSKLLGLEVNFQEYLSDNKKSNQNTLMVIHVPCSEKVVPGLLNPANSDYVIRMLKLASELTLKKEFAAVTTAPIHKGVINASGVPFSGHTEFFAEYFGVDKVVMMLASSIMRVALVTNHIPISCVASYINKELLIKIIKIIHSSFQKNYGINKPKIYVAGLNPHAGENGYIGREEIEIIIPTLDILRSEGINLEGPLSADTMFSKNNIADADVFLAMYHDQGLPVLKYNGFSDSVNVTLGLPIIRTSVDHGTALNLAGTNKVNNGSLNKAIQEAILMSQRCKS